MADARGEQVLGAEQVRGLGLDIEQADAPIRQDRVELAPLVDGTIGRLRTFAERQSVELGADVPSDLPPVRGDAERISQLLINLVHNAIKFSPDGGRVTIAAEVAGAADGEVMVSVSDEGEGLPEAERVRVFERFYKVDRARERRVGGTGLGLAVARHIVEAHGGRIEVDSVEGEGSTFRFTLPLA